MTQTSMVDHESAVARYRRISLWVAVALALLWLVLGWLGAFACTSCQNTSAAAGVVAPANSGDVASASASASTVAVAGVASTASAGGASLSQQSAVPSAVAPVVSTSAAVPSVPAEASEQACGPAMNLTVSFATGSANLTKEGKAQLAGVVKCINGPTLVGGHSDSQGSEALNLRLSAARAQTAMAYLKQRGVKPEWLSAKGFGSSQAIADNSTPLGRQKNRRIALVAR